MSVPVKTELICRTCMSKNVQLVSVFEAFLAENVEMKMSDVLPLCASVQIYVGDSLPDRICVHCAEELKRAYLFRKKCEESDSTLRGGLVSIKQEVPTGNETVCEQVEPLLVEAECIIKVKNEESDESLNDAGLQVKCSSEFGVAQNNEEEKVDSKIILDNNTETFLSFDKIEFVNVLNCGTSANPDEDINTTIDLQHSCAKCEQTFETDGLLRKHVTTHVKKTYKCNVCGKELSWKHSYNDHMMQHSGEVGQHSCKTCGKRCITVSRLKAHERIHSDDKPFLCSICGKRFIVALNLENHLTTHTGLKPYKCEECGKNFARKLLLDAHSLTHAREKTYDCEACGKRYLTNGSLTKHKKTHEQEKPFQCDVCNKRFFLNYHLVSHQRTHTRERPYECGECGDRFVSKCVLKNHMLRHTGEKPYVCEHCGQSFRHNGTYGNHKRLVHKLEKRKS